MSTIPTDQSTLLSFFHSNKDNRELFYSQCQNPDLYRILFANIDLVVLLKDLVKHNCKFGMEYYLTNIGNLYIYQLTMQDPDIKLESLIGPWYDLYEHLATDHDFLETFFELFPNETKKMFVEILWSAVDCDDGQIGKISLSTMAKMATLDGPLKRRIYSEFTALSGAEQLECYFE